MAFNHNRRLDRLEETHRPKELPRGHRIICRNEAESEREKQKMIESGVVAPGDFFIARLIVSP
jgi:hypothetical protein